MEESALAAAVGAASAPSGSGQGLRAPEGGSLPQMAGGGWMSGQSSFNSEAFNSLLGAAESGEAEGGPAGGDMDIPAAAEEAMAENAAAPRPELDDENPNLTEAYLAHLSETRRRKRTFLTLVVLLFVTVAAVSVTIVFLPRPVSFQFEHIEDMSMQLEPFILTGNVLMTVNNNNFETVDVVDASSEAYYRDRVVGFGSVDTFSVERRSKTPVLIPMVIRDPVFGVYVNDMCGAREPFEIDVRVMARVKSFNQKRNIMSVGNEVVDCARVLPPPPPPSRTNSASASASSSLSASATPAGPQTASLSATLTRSPPASQSQTPNATETAVPPQTQTQIPPSASQSNSTAPPTGPPTTLPTPTNNATFSELPSPVPVRTRTRGSVRIV